MKAENSRYGTFFGPLLLINSCVFLFPSRICEQAYLKIHAGLLPNLSETAPMAKEPKSIPPIAKELKIPLRGKLPHTNPNRVAKDDSMILLSNTSSSELHVSLWRVFVFQVWPLQQFCEIGGGPLHCPMEILTVSWKVQFQRIYVNGHTWDEFDPRIEMKSSHLRLLVGLALDWKSEIRRLHLCWLTSKLLIALSTKSE